MRAGKQGSGEAEKRRAVESEADAMVRTRYVGAQGKLKHRQLAGLESIGPGHAVDMPRRLAEELIARGLFVLEGDYPPPGPEPEVEAEGERGHGATEEEGEVEGAVQSFVEIGGAVEPGTQSLVEIGAETGEGETPAPWQGSRPLAAGDLAGLGEFKREALMRAGVGDWQTLAALDDDECERLAAELIGISAGQMKQWRDEALAGLARQAMGLV